MKLKIFCSPWWSPDIKQTQTGYPDPLRNKQSPIQRRVPPVIRSDENETQACGMRYMAQFVLLIDHVILFS